MGKVLKHFLGESHAFSRVLFIVFMDACWFSHTDLHTCFSMHIHYIPEIQKLHWQGECTALHPGRVLCLAFPRDWGLKLLFVCF